MAVKLDGRDRFRDEKWGCLRGKAARSNHQRACSALPASGTIIGFLRATDSAPNFAFSLDLLDNGSIRITANSSGTATPISAVLRRNDRNALPVPSRYARK